MGPNNPIKQTSEFSSLDSMGNSFGGASSRVSVNLPFVLSWISIAIAVVGMLSIWLLDVSVIQSNKQKQSQKDTLIQKITGSEYSVLDHKVSGLRSAYDEIKKNLSNKFYLNEFLPELYKRVDTDVQIKNISITDQGKINIDGIAESYRSVADQMLAFQTFNKLENVELLSTSMNISNSGKAETTFAFVADIVKDSEMVADQQNIETIGDSNANSLNSNISDNSNSSVDEGAVIGTGGTDEAN